jgi:voltage-gated potassium channel
MAKSSGNKEVDEFIRKLKIFFWIIVGLLVVGTFGFRSISEKTIEEAFFRTIQTLAFIFKDGSLIHERLLEIFLSIVGVFLIWWVLWGVADMILDGNLRKYLKTKFYSFKINQMNKHIIIVGGGRVGEEIARAIYLRNKPFLVIESDPKIITSLKKKNYVVIEGDALNEEVLRKANLGTASKMIITLPKTESNIVITLTAKEINPKVEIHSRCENSSLVSKLKRAGAKVVTVPEIVAADKIAKDLGI